MQKILTIVLTLLTAATVVGQNFEGKITYKNTYKSKMPKMTDEQFSAMMGTKQEYYIKGGNYKSVTNGTFSPWQIYVNKDNKLYTKLSYSETIYWTDGSVNSDSIIKIMINKNVIELLGYKCDELIFICKSGTQKYYFNSQLGIDTKLFENHKYGNWYEYLKQTNAVPLKIIIDNAQYSMENIAIEVKPMKLEDTEFQLPANVKTAKSPY